MSQRRNIDDIRIFGMNQNFPDRARVAQSDVFPGLSRVDRLVDAVALCDIAAQGRLAGAHVNHIGIGRDTASAPMENEASWSKIGDQVTAPSVDFQTPPPAAPK